MATIRIVVEGKDRGASKVLSSVGGALKGLAGLAAGAGAAGVAGIGLVGGALGKLAFDAMPLQGIRASFEGLTDSFVGGSDAMLQALQEGSTGMINNRELMMQFNSAAQLITPQFAQTLPDAMQYMGKISASTGKDFDFLLDSFITATGRLSPMIADNLNVQVSLADATARAAEMFGVEEEQLTKTQQQMGFANIMLEKMAENTAAMPEVTGTATATWGQLKTMFQNTKDELGEALLPALTILLEKVGALASIWIPKLVAWFRDEFVPVLEEKVVPWIADKLVPAINKLWYWIANNLPPAIAKLSKFWETVLKPSLEAIWGFVETSLIPILSDVWDWLGTNLPPVIKGLSDLWRNSLQPAIEAIWHFLSVDMLPIWEALAELFEARVGKQLTAMQGLWENVLKPALEDVWQFLEANVIPIFEGWVASMGGVSGIIQGIADAIGRLAERARNLQLPDWLIPGSPTPFELGIRGIADAMGELNRLQGPGLDTIPLAAQTSSSARARIGGGPQKVVYINLNANYPMQRAGSLRDDIRLLEQIYGAR